MNRLARVDPLDERRTPPVLRRLLLAALAIGGTAAYAASFRYAVAADRLFPVAVAVAVAAGTSWVVFGVVLLFATRGRVVAAANLCLAVMGLGMVPLLTAAFANVTAFAATRAGSLPIGLPLVVFTHAGLLVVADVLMGAAFTSAAPRVGLAPRRGLLLWVLGLNGTFAVLVTVLGAGRFWS